MGLRQISKYVAKLNSITTLYFCWNYYFYIYNFKKLPSHFFSCLFFPLTRFIKLIKKKDKKKRTKLICMIELRLDLSLWSIWRIDKWSQSSITRGIWIFNTLEFEHYKLWQIWIELKHPVNLVNPSLNIQYMHDLVHYILNGILSIPVLPSQSKIQIYKSFNSNMVRSGW